MNAKYIKIILVIIGILLIIPLLPFELRFIDDRTYYRMEHAFYSGYLSGVQRYDLMVKCKAVGTDADEAWNRYIGKVNK